jgi:hypothetical protein
MFPLPFGCCGRKSATSHSRQVLKPKSIFGTPEITFARLPLAIIQDHEQANERSTEDVVTESYAQPEASNAEYSVAADPSSSSDNAVKKAELPTRRDSLENKDVQRVSYCNSAALFLCLHVTILSLHTRIVSARGIGRGKAASSKNILGFV